MILRLARFIRPAVLLVLAFIIGNIAMADQPTQWRYLDHTAIPWRPYGPPALAQAKNTGRPLFVLIFSDTCHWCRKYETETIEQPAVRRLIEGRFIPVAVDLDREPAVGRELGAKLVPTTLILAPDGTKLLRFHGVQPAADLADTLEKTLALWRRGESAQPDFGDFETCCPVGKEPNPSRKP